MDICQISRSFQAVTKDSYRLEPPNYPFKIFSNCLITKHDFGLELCDFNPKAPQFSFDKTNNWISGPTYHTNRPDFELNQTDNSIETQTQNE